MSAVSLETVQASPETPPSYWVPDGIKWDKMSSYPVTVVLRTTFLGVDFRRQNPFTDTAVDMLLYVIEINHS